MKLVKLMSLGIALMLLTGTKNTAQESVTIKMALSGRPGQTTVIPLEFGIKKGATDGLDKALGEKQIPPFFPPSGLEGRLAFSTLDPNRTDSTKLDSVRYHSYKDFRGFEDSLRFKKEYELILQPAAQRRDPDPKEDYLNVYITWDKLPSYIDSARLQSAFNIINVDMKATNQYILTNEFIDDFTITVYYNLEATGVEEVPPVTEKNRLQLYPNPAQDELFIHLEGEQFQYKIFSVTGHSVMAGSGRDLLKIDLNTLPQGVYAVSVTGEKTTNVRQFIKQ